MPEKSLRGAETPRLIVAAGLIQSPEKSGQFLVSRRLKGTHLAERWEFPGGKVRLGENPQTTVRREIREELGVDVHVGDIFAVGHHVYEQVEVILLIYEATIEAGTPQCLQVSEIRWVSPEELVELDLPPADLPVIDKVKSRYL